MDGTPSFRTAHLLRLQSVTRRRRMVPLGPNLRRAATIRVIIVNANPRLYAAIVA